jgi:hypothetical protein
MHAAGPSKMPTWHKDRQQVGLEHLLLTDETADGVILGFDEEHGAFRLTYQLQWEPSWQLRDARLLLATARGTRSLQLQTDGEGHWRLGNGQTLDALEGCRDIDIWPTPLTLVQRDINAPACAVRRYRGFFRAWQQHNRQAATSAGSDQDGIDGYRSELPSKCARVVLIEGQPITRSIP